jgi:xylulokinase
MRWASRFTFVALTRPARNVTDLLLGIDVGTASSKGVLVYPDGSLVADVRAEHSLAVPRPGWAEQDADTIWWADVCTIARRLVAAVPAGSRIAGIAVSAIGPTLLPLDESGRPLRSAILYGVDTRATAQITALEAKYGVTALHELSGMGLTSQAVGPKIVWLREHQPEIVARARWFVTASSYLAYRLSGELAIDAHTASHWNPLFDPRTIKWTDRFAEGITTLDRLPRIGWPSDPIGVVTTTASKATGLPVGVPVAVGTVDVQSEALSVGVMEPGDVMIMYGSTTFFLLVTGAPLAADPLWLVAGAEPGRWNLAAELATSGSAMAWFRDRFAPDLAAAESAGGQNAFAALASEATKGETTDREDILFLPYLSGERTPINDPAARGVIVGLSLHSTRGDVYRGLLQGIAYAVRSNLEAMRNLGATIRRVVAVGGGTADQYFLGLVSDVCGVEQEVPSSTIGAARGDAFLAGLAAGTLHRADLAGWVSVATTIRPDPEARAGHDRRYPAFRRLYAETRDTVHGLSAG